MKKSVVGNIILGVLATGVLILAWIMQPQLNRWVFIGLMAVGLPVFGRCLAHGVLHWMHHRNPQMMRKHETALNDERYTMIRYRARAKASSIVQWLVLGIAYLMIVMDQPIWMTLIVVGVFLSFDLMTTLFAVKYDREM